VLLAAGCWHAQSTPQQVNTSGGKQFIKELSVTDEQTAYRVRISQSAIRRSNPPAIVP
jgi:hypothetical protein